MHLLLHSILSACFCSLVAIAAPYEPILLQRRNGSLTSPTISTAIHSSNGTDVSSSFQTLVYYQPDDILHTTNLTERQVVSVRRIDRCRTPSAQFLGSICTHSQGKEVSLWRYTIHCRIERIPMFDLNNPLDPSQSMPLDPRFVAEHGSCEDHEICVNSMPHEEHQAPVATCVDMKNFLPATRQGGGIPQSGQGGGGISGQQLGDALREIGDKKAGVTFTDQDGSSVIELDSLEVDVGVQGSHDSGELQQQKCNDCYGMRTKPAPTDADTLKIEATLMATAALTGVIWVTVFAG